VSASTGREPGTPTAHDAGSIHGTPVSGRTTGFVTTAAGFGVLTGLGGAWWNGVLAGLSGEDTIRAWVEGAGFGAVVGVGVVGVVVLTTLLVPVLLAWSSPAVEVLGRSLSRAPERRGRDGRRDGS